MGYWDSDKQQWINEESDETPAPAPALSIADLRRADDTNKIPYPDASTPTADEKRQFVRERLLDKFRKASDDSEVQGAQDDYRNASAASSLIEGIGQIASSGSIARGGPGVRAGQLDNVRGFYKGQVDDARQQRKDKMDGVMKEDDISWQDESRDHQRGAWNRDDEANDPASEKSRAYQGMVSAAIPGIASKLGEGLNKLSAADIERNFPKLTAAYAKSQPGAGKASDWQILPLQNENGSVRYVNYNKITGEQKPIEGNRGFSPKVVKNPYTGAWEQLVPGSGAAPVGGTGGAPAPLATGGTPAPAASGSAAPATTSLPGPRKGETPAEYKRRRDVEDAAAKNAGKFDEKDKDALQESEASRGARAALQTEMVGLYDGAKNEGKVFDNTGPVGGRLSEFQVGLGMSAGAKTDRLIARSQTALANYIKEKSGTAASDAEVARLKQILPSIHDDRQLYINKWHAALDEADAVVAKNRARAGMAPAATEQPVATPTPEDQQALDWLRANPSAPQSEDLRAHLKAKGLL